MYFGVTFLTIIAGCFFAGICGLLPPEIQPYIPMGFRMIAFFVGIIIAVAGFILLVSRASKVGANHLINPSRPGGVLWLFVYRDREIKITPSVRTGEGQLYNRELDSQVIDVVTYSIGDHKVRIVPEVVGHAVDLDYVMYVNLLKSKYGFENLKEVREKSVDKILNKFGINRQKEVPSYESIAFGKEIRNVQRSTDEYDESEL